MIETEGKDIAAGEHNRAEEEVEKTVVSYANAVADPWAMMIKAIDTIIAYAAVAGAGWAEQMARHAILQLHVDITHMYLTSPRR